MICTEKQLIDVIRDAAERWWFECPREFRREDGTINVPALKGMMHKVNGITCAVNGPAKDVARHIEWMDAAEKERHLEAALSIYRVGYRIREMEEALCC